MVTSLIGSAIRAKLLANAELKTLIKDEIYPKVLPQPAKLPAIVYSVISDIPTDDVSGNASLYRAVIQLDSWAKTEAEVGKIDDLARRILMAFKGVVIGVTIKGIHHLQASDDFEAEVSDYREHSRFSVWYRRPNPESAND